MKISEISSEQLAEYLRIGEIDATAEIAAASAKSYIKSYTGLEDLDAHDDLAIAYLVLCADFYDNRQLSTDRNYSNLAVETILGMHSKNLLPGGD